MATVTLTLNDAEQQALRELFDAMLRQAGLNALDVVYHFRGRIAAAQGTNTQAGQAGMASANPPAASVPVAQATAHPAKVQADAQQTQVQPSVQPVTAAQPAQGATMQPHQLQPAQVNTAQVAQAQPLPAQSAHAQSNDAQGSSGTAAPQHQSILGELVDGLIGKQHAKAAAPTAASAATPSAAAPGAPAAPSVPTSLASSQTAAQPAAATAPAPAQAPSAH